ncbi:hypothetical protein CLV35_1661 [Motilibacter peucedani]|uniref:Uncharacterized protein n=1 Tax=Motilibacter peucedani TaxID=598650 RepID=A0A420XSV0_9ACTN|nr:hypothetical protein [Motilibacter peucedani]RKS77956.1 hypothetical protein CLV35_1661 [Motilibacter peucedani]
MELAQEMFAQCVAEEQSARWVSTDDEASRLRAELRRLARAAGVRVRTARAGDSVVVVRLDAAVWDEDATSMRRKLTPHVDR